MKGKYLRMLREVGFGPYRQVDFLMRQGREVARKHSLLILPVAFALAALAGRGAVVAGSNTTVRAANTVPGLYELSFDTTGAVPLTNNRRPVGQELVRIEHLHDTSGNPRQRGDAAFHDCA